MSDFDLRFGGVRRVYGAGAVARLRGAHLMVVGLGGVGSWSVEALARSGIGALTLVDLDDVCLSNVNRQLPALDGTIGRPKAEVLAERVRAIHPGCRVTPVLEFLTADSVERLLSSPPDGPPLAGVLDAIDRVVNKCVLIHGCRERGIPVVSCGAAGGRRDASRIRVEDLARVTHDRLLGGVRKRLRQEHGFPRGDRRMGVECVFSPEEPVFPREDGTVCDTPAAGGDSGIRRLNCNSGMGSSVFVTGTFGLVAAGRLVDRLLAAGS